MLFFGHIGITAGAFAAYDVLVSKVRLADSHQTHSNLKSDVVVSEAQLPLRRLRDGIRHRLRLIDYRMVVLGSLLPDAVDKPVWLIVTRVSDNISLSGRDYAHTLLFNLVLLLAGGALIRSGKPWLLVLSVSSLTHLVFDEIWSSPAVLLWPLLGPLPKGETVGWVSGMAQGLFSYPGVYVPEIVGLVIVLLFAYRLVMRRSLANFVRNGVVG